MERKLLPKRLEHPALRRQPLWRDDSDLCTFGKSSRIFPREKIISLTLTAVGEFTLIYLIISGAIYYHTYRNIQKINSGLSSKS